MIQQEPLFGVLSSRLSRIIFYLNVIIFFVLSLFLTFHFKQTIFNSPDETANYYFAKQFQEKNNFLLPAPSETNLPSFVHPRSMLRQGAVLLPVGFLGFPFFLGVMAKIVSLPGLPFLIIFLTALAILIWHAFLKAIFGRQWAIFSAFLWLLSPALLYYALRPFSPNILFLDFLIFAVFCLIKSLALPHFQLPEAAGSVATEIPLGSKTKLRRVVFSFLFGLFLGLALIIRPSEIIWVAPTAIFGFIFFGRQLKFSFFVCAAAGAVLPFLPVLYLQKLTYGNYLATGYYLTPLGESVGAWRLLSLLLPFGFHPRAAGNAALSYIVDLFWWFSFLAILGAVVFAVKIFEFPKIMRRKMASWLGLTVFVFLVLIFFYGPWQVRDRLDNETSIGISFVRYFLPIYWLMTPLAAWGFLRAWQCFGRRKTLLASFFVVVAVFLSLRTVWWKGDESALAIFTTLRNNEQIRVNLLKITPENSIILTERSDKIFFPFREVMSFFREPSEAGSLKDLPKERELWYETINSQDDVAKENQDFWSIYGWQALGGESLGFGHKIYRLVPIKNSKLKSL